MDLGFSAEEIAFRAQVREFVANNLPASIRDKLAGGHHPSKDDIVTWTRILAKKGWGAPHWPVEWGGTGWDAIKLSIFTDEIQRGHAPETVKKVERLLYLSEYKRRQAAPGVKITERNFGRDRRYPIVNRFRESL